MPQISDASFCRLRQLCAAAEVLLGRPNDDENMLRAFHEVKEECRRALGQDVLMAEPPPHSYEDDRAGLLHRSNKTSRQAFLSRVSIQAAKQAAKSKMAEIKSIIAEFEKDSLQIVPEIQTRDYLERIEGVLASKRKAEDAGLDAAGPTAKKPN